jgi:hypothetical protein
MLGGILGGMIESKNIKKKICKNANKKAFT